MVKQDGVVVGKISGFTAPRGLHFTEIDGEPTLLVADLGNQPAATPKGEDLEDRPGRHRADAVTSFVRRCATRQITLGWRAVSRHAPSLFMPATCLPHANGALEAWQSAR